LAKVARCVTQQAADVPGCPLGFVLASLEFLQQKAKHLVDPGGIQLMPPAIKLLALPQQSGPKR